MAPTRRWLVVLLLAALVAAGCDLDEAELARPDSGLITAEVGQLRVLGYDVDPEVDDWIDVVRPDPDVVVETGTFRETDSALLAEGDTPGDRRRLFEAVGVGRTLLVELDCAGDCLAGDVDIHVWEFAVGDAAALSEATEVLTGSASATRRIGEFFVIVSDDGGPWEIPSDPTGHMVAAPVASYTPSGEGGTHVDVFIAVAEGQGEIRDSAGERVFTIEVTGAG